MEKTKTDAQYTIDAIKKNIKDRYKPEPEWEDKHPFLITMIILGVMLFNPVSLMVIGIFTFMIIVVLLMGGII